MSWVGCSAGDREGTVGTKTQISLQRKSLVNSWLAPLTLIGAESSVTPMSEPNFDELLWLYKEAVERWIGAIRAEASLATDDHSMVAMEKWDDAGFKLHDAELAAKKARDAYKNALRKKNYGF
jgi:hypothetical protein